MFNGFLGKGKKPVAPPDAVDSRGLEVVEDECVEVYSLSCSEPQTL